MKSMLPRLAAIFFMTNFYRAGGGGMAPLAPDPLLLFCVGYRMQIPADQLGIVYFPSKWLGASTPFGFRMLAHYELIVHPIIMKLLERPPNPLHLLIQTSIHSSRMRTDHLFSGRGCIYWRRGFHPYRGCIQWRGCIHWVGGASNGGGALSVKYRNCHLSEASKVLTYVKSLQEGKGCGILEHGFQTRFGWNRSTLSLFARDKPIK